MKKNKSEKLYNAITEIDERFIEEAGGNKKNKVPFRMKWAMSAACLCIAAALGFAAINHISRVNDNKTVDISGDKQNVVSEGADTPVHAASSEQEKSKYDTESGGTVKYSELALPETEDNEEVLNMPVVSEDIAMFDENMLRNQTDKIVEGKITNLYVKEYKYDVYDDKFGEGRVLHNICNTVVYEVAVDRTWYGDDISGQTIVIEDSTASCFDPLLILKKGMKCVLPVYVYGEKLSVGDGYAGGNITRAGIYSSIYPFQPPIQVTTDGLYLVCGYWKTLTAKNAKKVIMDESYDGSYRDIMYLVDENTFEQQMKVLIEKI